MNWTLFAIILSDIAPSSATTVGGSLGVSIALVVMSFVLILGVGRWLGPRTLHWLKGHVSWPMGPSP